MKCKMLRTELHTHNKIVLRLQPLTVLSTFARPSLSLPHSKKFFTFNQSTFVSHLVCPPQCMLNLTKCIRSNGIGIFIINIHSTSSFVPSASARTLNASAYRIPCENPLRIARDCTGVLPMKIALKKSDEKKIEIIRVHDDVKRRC